MSKKNLLFILVVAYWAVSCSNNNSLSLTNPLDTLRTDEVIILKYKELAERFHIPENKVLAFKVENNYIPCQADDLDQDGKWDEAVFLLDFEPSETKTVEVVFLNQEEYPEFEKRTNLRLGILQDDGTYKEVDEYFAPSCDDGFEIIAQGESVCWENDKMAFRVYFDCRNVKDLYGKLKPEMIIDKIGTPEMGDYHTLADWGMDILHCGSSLGSGGIALMQNDSLYRLGSTKQYEYVKRAEGPVRSVFDLVYGGWDVNGDSLTADEHIS
ncbi:MAG: DUF4861 family protein, partial [Prolixibacteraceae bacterium]|nr:DUF4861 family protein [Prolixibacteraceae bacterium]